MKTIVISDVHLTSKFDQRKYDYLGDIISSSDKLIINGDLWDRFYTDFDSFLKSDWSKLFSLMKKKKTVYIYGNHDPAHHQDSRNQLFSTKQVEEYVIELDDGRRLNLNHGDLITHGTKYRDSKVKLYSAMMNSILSFAEAAAVNTFGYTYNRAIPQINHLEKLYKKYSKESLKSEEILVTGHIHKPIFNPEEGYINTGYVMYGNGFHLDVDSNIDLQLVHDRY